MSSEMMTNRIEVKRYSEENFTEEKAYINRESAITLIVNGEEFMTLLCSPNQIIEFVMGYLYNEKIIAGLEDIDELYSIDEHSVAVALKDKTKSMPVAKIRTSGLGNGITFQRTVEEKPIETQMKISPKKLLELMRKKETYEETYQRCGGIHSTALCDSNTILAFAEDIGRHNTFDKVCGVCLKNGIDMKDKLLITSGRISSEMVQKAVRTRIPIIVSLSTATEKAIRLARKMNVTLIGYCRNTSFTIYTNWDKIREIC